MFVAPVPEAQLQRELGLFARPGGAVVREQEPWPYTSMVAKVDSPDSRLVHKSDRAPWLGNPKGVPHSAQSSWWGPPAQVEDDAFQKCKIQVTHEKTKFDRLRITLGGIGQQSVSHLHGW